MRTVYYQEPNGDFMAVYYGIVKGREPEVRASALDGVPSSVCSTTASRGYIKTCRTVLKADVPQAWKRWF
jgi:hypothetical protein